MRPEGADREHHEQFEGKTWKMETCKNLLLRGDRGCLADGPGGVGLGSAPRPYRGPDRA